MKQGNICQSLKLMYSDRATSGEQKSRIVSIMENRYKQPLYLVSNGAHENSDPEIDYMGYDLESAHNAISLAERLSDYDGEQDWLLLARLEGEEDTVLDMKTISDVNSTTDELLNEVTRHFVGKYTSHTDSKGNHIKLRISNHSGKWINNRGTATISVVIANKNATEKFALSDIGIKNELFFNEKDTTEEIINAINSELEIY